MGAMSEWDPRKAKENKSKHGVSFADAFAVFEAPNAVTIDDYRMGEHRHVTIGMDTFGRVLVAVYTWREDAIRIISARKAVRYEVRQYEGEI